MIEFDTPGWFRDAACTTADPDAWFPEQGAAATTARKICADCPVLDLCREYAIERRDLEGIWGGTTERDRRNERRRRAAAEGRRVPTTVKDPLTLAPHGTAAAARRHWRAKDPLCEPCRVASNRDKQQREEDRRAAGVEIRPGRDRAAEHREYRTRVRKGTVGDRARSA